MYRLNAFLFYLIVFLALSFGCSEEQSHQQPTSDGPSTFDITINVSDSDGNFLTPSAIEILDPEKGRDSRSEKVFRSSEESDKIQGYAQIGEPHIVKVSSPNHQPVYLFIPSYYDQVFSATVTLTPSALPQNFNPMVVGSFNSFDHFRAIEMRSSGSGIWAASAETEPDTIYYQIIDSGIHNLSLTSTEHLIKSKFDIDHGWLSVIEDSLNQTIDIVFDETFFSETLTKPDINIGDSVPVSAAGISKVYAQMAYMMSLINFYEESGETLPYDLFDDFINDIETIANSYSHPAVEDAAKLAQSSFTRYINHEEDWIDSVISAIPSTSDLWLMHYPIISELYDHSSKMESVSKNIWSIYQNHSSKKVQGEALYNMLKFHYYRGEDEEWYQAHYDLVRLYPEHKRINYSYKNRFAPSAATHLNERFPSLNIPEKNRAQSINPHDIRGDITVILFWSRTNSDVADYFTQLNELYEDYSSSLSILTVAIDENRERVGRFFENLNINWHSVTAPLHDPAIQVLGVTATPHTIIFNHHAEIILNEQKLPEVDLVDNFLKQHSPEL